MNLFYIIALLVTAFSKPVEDVTDNTNSIETSLESEQNTTSEYPAYLPKFPKHISKISTGSKPEINFIYHGGSIIRNVNTFVILINRPNFDFEIINYYKNVYQTDVFEFLNEEYSTKNYVIGKGGYLGSITKTVNSNVYEDGDIQKWLDDWIQDKSIPIPDANTFFAIHTNNIDIIKFGATSCKNYCGYHGTHFYNKTLYTYGIVPDQVNDACKTLKCGPGNPLQNTLAVGFHELVEAVTDPGVNAGDIGYFDWTHGEIADVCSQKQATVPMKNGNSLLVQKVWSPILKGCVTPIPNKFNQAVDSANSDIISRLSHSVGWLTFIVFICKYIS